MIFDGLNYEIVDGSKHIGDELINITISYYKDERLIKIS